MGYAAFLKHGAGHVVECISWPCLATFIFAFQTPPFMTLAGHFAIYVRWLLGSLRNLAVFKKFQRAKKGAKS